MTEDFKYPTNIPLRNLLITNDGDRLSLMSLLGIGGEYHSLTIEDTKIYPEDDERNNQIKTMILSLDLDEMEKIGKALLERVDRVKNERKKST